MNRVPIRVRLTGVFVAVMGGVLLVIGLFLYYRTEHELDAAINQALSARQGSLRASAAGVRRRRADAIPPGERFAQVLAPDGRVLAGRPDRAAPLLTSQEARRASTALVTIDQHERNRLLAGPALLQGRRVVAVAATSLADRERALESLGGALLIGGPLALLLAASVAYALAAGALSPVEGMRRRAASISRAAPGAELPVPAANDEVRRLALTLNDMLARLAAAAEHELSFVANASHELRTPLAALNAELELALRHEQSADGLRAAIGAARRDGGRLARLASDLLDLARADEPHGLSHEQVDVDHVLMAAVGELRHVARGRDRELVARPSGFTAVGDELALARALRNMTENALVHGTGTVTLGADLLPGQQRIRVWVCDDGALDDGLAEGAAFERFTRGPATNGTAGAGLGLALVRAVAEAHAGTASLEAVPGGGVRASLTVPLA